MTYEGLKLEILARHAQLVRAFHSTIFSHAQMSDLVQLTKGWLLTDVPSLPINDKVVLDEYLFGPSPMR